ncbi:MAG: asparaginase domain-containing protein [Saccharofermentans sp.]|nr:asparaginase domain-containing protein [Saccharofermentans sp.]
MKILVELLGGTIGSYKDENGTVVLGRDMSDILPGGVDTVIRSPLTYSSENAAAEVYRDALKAISHDMDETSPEGVLILHGTDTMAYLAQLAVRVLGTDIPVQIAGSVLPPDDPESDYKKQIKDAVRFLKDGKSGVVCGGRSIPLDKVMSADIAGRYSEYGDCKPLEYSKDAAARFLENDRLPRVLVIPAVPGYVIPEGGFDRVLIQCFHSGTANQSLVPYIKKWTSEGKRCFLAPFPAGGNIYESTKMLCGAGAEILLGMPFEGAWAEALLI